MLIQILLIAFMVFALSRVVVRYRGGELSPGMSLFWVVLWLVAGAVVLKPNSTTEVAHLLGVGRGVDLLFYVSITALFYFIFRLFIRFEKMERSLTEIVRHKALRDTENEPKK